VFEIKVNNAPRWQVTTEERAVRQMGETYSCPQNLADMLKSGDLFEVETGYARYRWRVPLRKKKWRKGKAK